MNREEIKDKYREKFQNKVCDRCNNGKVNIFNVCEKYHKCEKRIVFLEVNLQQKELLIDEVIKEIEKEIIEYSLNIPIQANRAFNKSIQIIKDKLKDK